MPDRLFALATAAVTATALASCSSITTLPPNTGNSQAVTEEAAAPYPELSAAGSKQKIQSLAAKCGTDKELYPSSYGVWKKSKPCKLPITSSLSITINGFHQSKEGEIDAAQAITASPDAVAILSGRYPGGSTSRHGAACVKLGKSGIPVLFIAAQNRCDALTYSQI